MHRTAGLIYALLSASGLALHAPAALADTNRKVEAREPLSLESSLNPESGQAMRVSSETIEHWLVTARSAMSAGRFEDAKRLFLLVHKVTGNDSIMLEYAQALFAQGEWTEAKAIFVAAYDSAYVPDEIKQTVRWYLQEIDARLPQLNASVSLVSDSNPANFTHHETVDVLGRNLTVVVPDSAKQAYGMAMNAKYSAPLFGSDTWFANATLGAKRYEVSSLNNQSVGAGISYRARNANQVVVDVASTRVTRSSASDYHQHSLSVYGLPVAQERLKLGVNLSTRQFEGEPSADMDYLSVSASQLYPLNQKWLARGDAKLTRDRAQLDYNSAKGAELGVTSYRSIRGVHWAPSISVSVRQFDATNPFFGKVREDRRAKVGVSASIGQKKYKAWRPKVSVFHERQSSNIEFFEYEKTFAELSFDF